MKLILIVFVTLFEITSLVFGQIPSIKKAWIGNNLEYLKITDSTALFENEFYLEMYNFKLEENKLVLINDVINITELPYEISKLSADTLILKPLNEPAKKFINCQEYFLLVDSSTIYDPYFKFEKIFFSGSTCFGTCRSMKIEIDSSGAVFFLGIENTGDYIGLYKGQLKPWALEKLIYILKHSWINNFPPELGFAVDAPYYHFSFYFNGQVKKSKGTFVPYFNNDLINYLLDIYNFSGLTKLNGTHEFDKQK